LFAILGEEGGEARLVCKGAGGVVFWLEWFNLHKKLERHVHARKTVGRTFHLSMSSVSHGLSFLCVDGIAAIVESGLVAVGGVCFAPGTFLHFEIFIVSVALKPTLPDFIC
jgi:hypothetical protein